MAKRCARPADYLVVGFDHRDEFRACSVPDAKAKFRKLTGELNVLRVYRRPIGSEVYRVAWAMSRKKPRIRVRL